LQKAVSTQNVTNPVSLPFNNYDIPQYDYLFLRHLPPETHSQRCKFLPEAQQDASFRFPLLFIWRPGCLRVVTERLVVDVSTAALIFPSLNLLHYFWYFVL
jgi:hypothetical protein